MKYTIPVMLLALGSSISFGQSAHAVAPGFGIVDCFGQGRVHASRLVGTVFDFTGVPVPGAKVYLFSPSTYLDPDAKPLSQTVTDEAGRFVLKAAPASYIFEVKSPVFTGAQVEIELGRDVVNVLRPTSLYVTLGMAGSYCPWVTTKRREFEHEVEDNKSRLQSHSEVNATLK